MNLLRAARLRGRKLYDSFYCKKWPEIESLGGVNSWHILTTGLDNNSIIYSFGVGHDISFERELVSLFNVNIELFDPSPTATKTMEMKENQSDKIRFSPVGLSERCGVIKFARPESEVEGSFRIPRENDVSVDFQCSDLLTLMNERGHSRIDLLKMDIEGFEYDVIDNILQNSIDIKQICVEFHHFMSHIKKEKPLRLWQT